MQALAPNSCLNLSPGRGTLLPSMLSTCLSWSGFSCLLRPVLLSSHPGSSPRLVAFPGLEPIEFCVSLVFPHGSQDFLYRSFSRQVVNPGQGVVKASEEGSEGLSWGVQVMEGQ